MENKENLNNQEEQSFAEMFEQSEQAQVTLTTGETKTGKVVKVTPTEVVVDLDFKFEGVIKLEDLTDDPDATPADICKVGDEIEVFIIRVNDSEGVVSLSKKKLEQAKNWEAIVAAAENEEILTGKVVDILASGVIVFVKGNKVFVPASQAAERYVADLSTLKGEEVSLRIIDVNERRHRVVGSIKKVAKEMSQKAKDEFFAKTNVGDKIEGTVKSVTDFGAFVDIGGVDGLVHVSELTWKKGVAPSDIVKVGDKLEVYIKAIDTEKGKVSLGHKNPDDDPWVKFTAKYNVGDIANGTVVRLVPFGAFVDIDGVEGLIHISQIVHDRRINAVTEVLNIGDEVEAKITDIKLEAGKVSLSIKALTAPEEAAEEIVEEVEEEVYEVPAEEPGKTAMEEALEKVEVEATEEVAE